MSDPHLGNVERIRELRAAVGRESRGEPSRTRAYACLEDGVLGALLHLRAEMSDELRRHISTRRCPLPCPLDEESICVRLSCRWESKVVLELVSWKITLNKVASLRLSSSWPEP
jgi:hypothetical protein